MSDDNDNVLTKPKKERSEAQKASYEKMVAARAVKMAGKPPPPPKEDKLTPIEKRLRLQAIKEQLAGNKAEPKEDTESEEDAEEIESKPILKKKEREKVVVAEPKKVKKEPKIIYQSASEDSESDGDVIIVKKKKKDKSKKKKKTIIYEESSSEEEEEEEPVKPIKKERETKTQQNSASKFKVIPGKAEKPKVVSPYYFAD